LRFIFVVYRSPDLRNLPNDFDNNRRIKMGGRGSGRRSSYGGKPQTSDCMPLDIRKIGRQERLAPGHCFDWRWLVNRREVSRISIRCEVDALVVSYQKKNTDTVVEQWLYMQATACHLGGQRQWFICPDCGKRVAVLYAPGPHFACRQCGQLAYPAQKECAGDRAASKANKLRRRLGWTIGIFNPVGGKPKGMHWSTYYRLKSEHDALVQISLHDVASKLGFLHKLQGR
jgi:hypothetical protein